MWGQDNIINYWMPGNRCFACWTNTEQHSETAHHVKEARKECERLPSALVQYVFHTPAKTAPPLAARTLQRSLYIRKRLIVGPRSSCNHDTSALCDCTQPQLHKDMMEPRERFSAISGAPRCAACVNVPNQYRRPSATRTPGRIMFSNPNALAPRDALQGGIMSASAHPRLTFQRVLV